MNSLVNEDNRSVFTENGARTLKSSKSSLVDFFGQGGALRTRQDSEIIHLFSNAFAEDKLTALKILFYLRDVRGGQGERNTFRVIWKWLITNYPEIAKANLKNVPYYGRWDDLFFDKGTIDFAIDLIREVITSDKSSLAMEDLTIFKWLPSNNTSSAKTRVLAKYISSKLGLSPKDYRKMLSTSRKRLNLVETAMSLNKWSEIKFENVPSRASFIYRKAFGKHETTRYVEYITKVEKGEAKINASVTYPYEIVDKYLNKGSSKDNTLDVIWKSLPNYMAEGVKGLVVADVSGSMVGLPMAVSVSLALYMAERNTDPNFKDYFITFSEKPNLVKIKGDSLYQKIRNISQADWGMSTNIQGVFDLILRTAVSNNVKKEDMPNVLYIVSDMEFNKATSRNSKTNFETIKDKYIASGYEMPTLVFWNVNARNSHSPVTFDERGVALVSGCSPSIFSSVLSGKSVTPYDIMMDTIGRDRYSRVIV